MISEKARPYFLSHPALRLLLFGGKGGVGKTTCAAATAIHLSFTHPENSFLLVSTDPAHSLLDSLNGSLPPKNLEIMELDAKVHLENFKALHGPKLQEIARRGTFLDDKDIQRFLNLSLPGMDELFAFLEISRQAEEANGSRTIIVDTAPTGHTLRLLGMPEFIRNWLDGLDALLAKHRYMKEVFRGGYEKDELDAFIEGMTESVESLEAMLRDRERCRFVTVMLAERLSVRETVGLVEELKRFNIPSDEIVVNKLYPENRCPVCAEGRLRQIEELRRLPKPLKGLKLWGVPLCPNEVKGTRSLGTFWDGLSEIDNRHLAASRRRTLSLLGSFVERKSVDDPAQLPHPEVSFIIFAGKGGVGKTTMACATALRMATEYPGKRVLLFSSDPAHSLSDCLDLKIGSKPKIVSDGLAALEIDPDLELASLKEEYFRELQDFFQSLSQSLDFTFDREVIERIMDLSPPGLDEVMALTYVMESMARGQYDLYILDSAPTGHLIRLLELPDVIDRWLKAFFELFLKYRDIFRLPKVSERLVAMSKALKKLKRLLTHPERASLYVVSIPTVMALEETKDLAAACYRLGMHIPALFLNMLTPTVECSFCTPLRHREEELVEEFRRAFPERHLVSVYRQEEPRGLERLTELGRNLYKG